MDKWTYGSTDGWMDGWMDGYATPTVPNVHSMMSICISYAAERCIYVHTMFGTHGNLCSVHTCFHTGQQLPWVAEI